MHCSRDDVLAGPFVRNQVSSGDPLRLTLGLMLLGAVVAVQLVGTLSLG